MTNLLMWFGKYMLVGILVEGAIIAMLFISCIALAIFMTGTKYVKSIVVGMFHGMVEALQDRKVAAFFMIGLLVWPIDALVHIHTNIINLSKMRESLRLAKEL